MYRATPMQEIQEKLDFSPEYREYLFKGGYLITDYLLSNMELYPFYNNWSIDHVGEYYFYVNSFEHLYKYSSDSISVVLIGHAYDPFNMEYDENCILKRLHVKASNQKELIDCLNNLTGVFTFFVVDNDGIHFVLDASGLHFTLFGFIDDHFWVSSHSKLLGDLLNLKTDVYVDKLVNYKYYHLKGNYLPGDISPYKAFKRAIPNFWYTAKDQIISKKRFYPEHALIAKQDNEEYQKVVQEFARILRNTMQLIALKWPSQKAWISLTGGKDSTTTLSCCNKMYDRFGYYSYFSDTFEETDALAASKICTFLGIQHKLFNISESSQHTESIKRIMEYNFGCIGNVKMQDARRRIYFSSLNSNHPFDVEVKSWAAEVGRSWYCKRFLKTSFPDRPTPRYLTTFYKFFYSTVILSRVQT